MAVALDGVRQEGSLAVTTNIAKRRNHRARLYIVLMIVVIALAGWYLDSYMNKVAGQRAQQHKQTFYQYVVTHHLGKLLLIDSGTGLDAMAYVLQMPNQIPDSQRASFAENLMHLYVKYDHGTLLSIVYVNPSTQVRLPVAECHYDMDSREFNMTITHLDGNTTQSDETVNW